jgi:hypothetical protein
MVYESRMQNDLNSTASVVHLLRSLSWLIGYANCVLSRSLERLTAVGFESKSASFSHVHQLLAEIITVLYLNYWLHPQEPFLFTCWHERRQTAQSPLSTEESPFYMNLWRARTLNAASYNLSTIFSCSVVIFSTKIWRSMKLENATSHVIRTRSTDDDDDDAQHARRF